MAIANILPEGESRAAPTAYYLSPEQIQSDLVIPQSDVYALGVVLYELLAGVVPFDGTSAAEVAQKHLTMQPVPLSQRRAGVPGWIDKVVRRALEKDPVARYGSVEELRQVLAGVA
jgi:serine/threonine-protein kinase